MDDEAVQRTLHNIHPRPWWGFKEERWAIAIQKTKDQGSSFGINEDDLENLQNTVTSLRLLHTGVVQPGPIYAILSQGGMTTLITPFFTYRVFPAKPEYVLHVDEIDDVKELWEHLSKVTSPNSEFMRIPIQRFNDSYSRVKEEDQLIDQMIAFESLYLGDDKELGYKLALRAALLLADDVPKRKEIRRRLKEAYKARGQIVHGSTVPANLPQLVADTKEYLRQSIKRFLKLSDQYTLKQLRDRLLDQNIIEAGQLLKTA
jgi:hypothetical protein